MRSVVTLFVCVLVFGSSRTVLSWSLPVNIPGLSLEAPTAAMLDMTCGYFAQYPQRANTTLQIIRSVISPVASLFNATSAFLNNPNALNLLTNTQTCPTLITTLYTTMMSDIQGMSNLGSKLTGIRTVSRVMKEIKTRKP